MRHCGAVCRCSGLERQGTTGGCSNRWARSKTCIPSKERNKNTFESDAPRELRQPPTYRENHRWQLLAVLCYAVSRFFHTAVTRLALRSSPILPWRNSSIALAEDLEEQLGAGLGQRHEAQFVNDQQFVAGEQLLEALQIFLIAGLDRQADQGGGAGESHAMEDKANKPVPLARDRSEIPLEDGSTQAPVQMAI
jgi:hypothetical protein